MARRDTLFAAYSNDANAPALGAFAITPSSTEFQRPIRQLTVGGQGSVRFIGLDGKEYTTGILPVGSYPVMAVAILSAGTTATQMTGWY